MTDVQAALNREALEHFESYKGAIAESWGMLGGEAYVRGVLVKEQEIPYLFQIGCNPCKLETVQKIFEEAGIASAWNFPCLPWLTLPCYPGMTRGEAQTIMSKAEEIMNGIGATIYTGA